MQPTDEQLCLEAQRIIDAGALGRSTAYARLLTFLVERTANGRSPKELEIAMEVFEKGPDFDPSQDAMVRVYVHNLRQKLQSYYAKEGTAAPHRVILPRGEYRVQLLSSRTPQTTSLEASREPPVLAPATTVDVPRSRNRFNVRATLGGVVLLLVGIVLGSAIPSLRATTPPVTDPVTASPAWAPLLDDDLPILVVMGDYYIFGERDGNGEVSRLVRDFGINSSKDLDDFMMYDTAARDRYLDLDLTYLPAGSALALRDVLRVAQTAHKPVRIASMSELSAGELKTGHVVYVGYLSALGMLEDFVFSSSGLEVGYNYDELRNRATGEIYSSEAGLPGVERNYRDYALLSTFPGPNGNQLLVVAGTRDAGLMQAAQVLSDPMFVGDIEAAAPSTTMAQAPALELLYEVTGYGRTNLDAMLVHSAELSYRAIWGGEFRHAGEPAAIQ